MIARIYPHAFTGEVTVPASKSHAIRRLVLASLTDGISHIELPPDSMPGLDIQSCAAACRVLGADITEERDSGLTGWTVRGHKPSSADDTAKSADPDTPDKERVIDVGNSGTTLFFAIAAAALGSAPVTFTGDSQIACRSAGPLLDALAGLGVTVSSHNGCIPITVRGPWKGGSVSVSCATSQYLSALLIAAPLAPQGTITEIEVPLLNEKPYVEMTLAYLKAQLQISEAELNSVKADLLQGSITAAPDFSRFRIQGGCAYTPVNGPIPGDFSSAAFPAAAAAISGGNVTLRGLDPGDTQGDKVFFEYLARMGCDVRWTGGGGNWRVTVSRSGPLRGSVFDLNAAPDLLPVMATLGAFAEGETVLVNAAHARIKETDRIAVMAAELRKLFAGGVFRCEEKPDGLVLGTADGGTADYARIAGTDITLDGRGDHRIVMALACAVLGLPARSGSVSIAGAEAADVTYPGFLELLGKVI